MADLDNQLAPWTYEISRPHGRAFIQSTERFTSAAAASTALCIYLASTPESAGDFIGRVILAREIPADKQVLIVLAGQSFH